MAETIYEFEKRLMQKQPPVGPEEYKQFIQEVQEWYNNHKAECFIFLSWDAHYCSLLLEHRKGHERFTDVLQDCINSIGSLQQVDYGHKEESLIFWINGEMYILSPYDEGVVRFV